MGFSIFADPEAENTALLKKVSEHTGARVTSGSPPDGLTFEQAKRTIVLRPNRGEFLKPCPCTPGHTCCGYRFLNIATNCPMDCTYCILQDYLGPQPVVIHSNTDNMLEELDRKLSDTSRIFRVGTGELTDSLAIDELTSYSKELVPFFASRANTIFELKTKTASIDNLIGLEHGRRTVTGWSVNPHEIARKEENGAVPVEQRIQAALRCQDAGYYLAFHFDPLIDYPGWRRGYTELVKMLTSSGIDIGNVAWISLGCVRFVPEMREILAERFPGSTVRTGQFVKGRDGKLRYFKPIRVDMYRTVAKAIRAVWPEAPLYLCMESSDVWKASLGYAPGNAELSRFLNERVP